MNFFQKYAAGGALRPDSFTGMNPDFSTALQSMIAGAPADVQQALQIYSGYRSPQKQQQLWNDALAKYGSPEAARKWVAPPGRSNHNKGLAADLKFVDDRTKGWVHDNAANYGLAFPLANEPWHVELASARGGKPANAAAAISAQMAQGPQPKTIAAEPMDRPAAIAAMAPEQSGGASMVAGPKMPTAKGGLGGLGGYQEPPDTSFAGVLKSDQFGDILTALGASLLAGNGAQFAQVLNQRSDDRARREENQLDRQWQRYTFGAGQEERAMDREARATDRADNNRFREADDRRADASLELQRQESERLAKGYQLITDPEKRAALGIPADDTRPYQLSPQGQLAAVGGIGQTQTPGVEARQREALAAQYGIDPKSAEGQRFILTGTLPASDKGVTAGDREAIRDADDAVMSGQSTMTLLDKAMELSGKAFEGPGAGVRATVGSVFGSDGALATKEYDNIVTEQALGQLKAIFGGAPTEGERAILLEIQGSSSQPQSVRDNILKRAKAAVERRVNYNQDRANELRGGTYYKPRAADPAASSPAPAAATPSVDDLVKKYGRNR